MLAIDVREIEMLEIDVGEIEMMERCWRDRDVREIEMQRCQIDRQQDTRCDVDVRCGDINGDRDRETKREDVEKMSEGSEK
eukprot:2245108-Ditylum_brightwellii.AAC.1